MTSLALPYEAPALGARILESVDASLEALERTLERGKARAGRFLRRLCSRRWRPTKAPKGYNGELASALRDALAMLHHREPRTLEQARMTISRIY